MQKEKEPKANQNQINAKLWELLWTILFLIQNVNLFSGLRAEAKQDSTLLSGCLKFKGQ